MTITTKWRIKESIGMEILHVEPRHNISIVLYRDVLDSRHVTIKRSTFGRGQMLEANAIVMKIAEYNMF